MLTYKTTETLKFRSVCLPETECQVKWCRSHCLHSRCGCDGHWYRLQMQGYLAATDTRPKPRKITNESNWTHADYSWSVFTHYPGGFKNILNISNVQISILSWILGKLLNCLFQILCASISVKLLTLTAPWCSLQQRTAWLSLPSPMRGHTHTKLSLPPLARYRPSGDHFSPQTSCEWPVSVEMWWSATLTSWWWMCPDLEPLGGWKEEKLQSSS